MEKIKFMTNSVSLGSGISLADIVAGVKGKNVKTASSSGTVKVAEKEEGKSSGQPEAEAKLTNEPKVVDEKSKSAAKPAASKSKDKGESSGQLDVEPLHQKGESVKPSAVTNENKKVEASKDKEEDKKDDDKKDKKDEKDEKAMEASKSLTASNVTRKVIKLSKLNSKDRARYRKYLLAYYPAAYVDAMLQEQ